MDDEYKFADDTFDDRRSTFRSTILNMKNSEKIGLFKKMIEDINNLPENNPNYLSDCLDIVYEMSLLICECQCKELTDLFMDLCSPDFILRFVNPESELIDPVAPILFIENSLSLPGYNIGEMYLDLGLFDFIMEKATEDIPLRMSIGALNNIIPSVTDEDQKRCIVEMFPLEKLLDVDIEENADLVYPLLYLTKSLIRLFGVEFNKEHADMFSSLLDKIFSAGDEYILEFDQEPGFYPLLNSFILQIPFISFQLPSSFCRHIIRNALTFDKRTLSTKCLSLALTIAQTIKQNTSSFEELATNLFDEFNKTIQRDGFSKIIPCLKSIDTMQKTEFYKFIKIFGDFYIVIYSEVVILPFVRFIQEDFQNGVFSIKSPIIKILRKFIQNSHSLMIEPNEYMSTEFIESVMLLLEAENNDIEISIKFFFTLASEFQNTDSWNYIVETLLNLGIVDNLKNIIDNNEDSRLCTSAEILLKIIENQEDDI